MKKTYIIPMSMAVRINCKPFMEGSVGRYDEVVSGNNGGWTKEDKTLGSDVNVWDSEW